jgi:hypothetical protein
MVERGQITNQGKSIRLVERYDEDIINIETNDDFNWAVTEFQLDTADVATIHDPEQNWARPRENEYGWWIGPRPSPEYILYSFPDAYFIQGFISMCDAFRVDFRDYVYGLPFKYDPETQETTHYQIEGYDIAPIQ